MNLLDLTIDPNKNKNHLQLNEIQASLPDEDIQSLVHNFLVKHEQIQSQSVFEDCVVLIQDIF